MALSAPKWSRNTRLQHASNNAPAIRPHEPDHAAVKLLQEVLISQGFPIPSGPTGNYSTETASAVRKVEEKFNLMLDTGVAGRQVLGVLDQLLQGKSPELPPLPPGGVEQHGAALAKTDVPLAQRKITKAIDAISTFRSTFVIRALSQVGESPPDFDQVTVDALRVHFRLGLPGTAAAPARDLDLGDLQIIQDNFTKVRAYLNQAGTKFQDSTTNPGTIGETVGGTGPTFFGTGFRNSDSASGQRRIGVNTRAAIVIHEPIHAVDTQSVVAVDINESSAAYTSQSADNSLHNPCSYAAFAAHVTKGSDPSPRFGLDEPPRGRFQ